jgi:hypothetical protein
MTELPVGLSNQPFYTRDRKDWAIEQEIYRHKQALYDIGEWAMFVLLWTVEDFKSGYVVHCPRCFSGDDVAADTSSVYKQSSQARCPSCYGTTFQGGIRAKLIRPTIFADTDDEETKSTRGVVHPQRVTVESTNDFRFRSGDFVFRIDGSRWQLSGPSRVTLRTGFEHPGQSASSIGYAPCPASLEDKTSVAYLIPPNSDQLKSLLTPMSRYPISANDLINGPLIPKGFTD